MYVVFLWCQLCPGVFWEFLWCAKAIYVHMRVSDTTYLSFRLLPGTAKGTRTEGNLKRKVTGEVVTQNIHLEYKCLPITLIVETS